jgi:hypothetical protein
MNNKKRYCSTLKTILQYLKKRNPVSLEGDNKELKKDAFLVPYFLFERLLGAPATAAPPPCYRRCLRHHRSLRAAAIALPTCAVHHRHASEGKK